MHGIHDDFPKLAQEGYEEKSPATPDYNCIAWAAGEDETVWWPGDPDMDYWPDSVPHTEDLESFFLAFESIGYVRCADGGLEAGFEKVALYAKGRNPKHAARQLDDGKWTSKLGLGIDIIHTLPGLEGPCYGQVVGFLKRPRPT